MSSLRSARETRLLLPGMLASLVSLRRSALNGQANGVSSAVRNARDDMDRRVAAAESGRAGAIARFLSTLCSEVDRTLRQRLAGKGAEWLRARTLCDFQKELSHAATEKLGRPLTCHLAHLVGAADCAVPQLW